MAAPVVVVSPAVRAALSDLVVARQRLAGEHARLVVAAPVGQAPVPDRAHACQQARVAACWQALARLGVSARQAVHLIRTEGLEQ